MHPEPPINPEVRRAYDDLNATGGRQRPSAEADARLRAYAREASASPRWIWPLSLAASAVLCVTFVYQFSRVLTPPPLPPQSASTPPAGSLPLVPEPAPDPLPATPADPGSRQWMALESPEDWWRQLRIHAQHADREAFLATWRAYQDIQQDVPLPEDLRQWIVANDLPAVPPG